MEHHDNKLTSGETLRSTSEDLDDALDEEYDLKSLNGGVQGKYYDRVQPGPNIVILAQENVRSRDMTQVLHFEFRPDTIAWIGDLQTRTKDSRCSEIRARYESWTQVGLGELALAIATRLAIVRRVELRLREKLMQLKDDVDQLSDLDSRLAGGYCYPPEDSELVFDVCAAVDSCFFEWRSLYEVLDKFAKTYCRAILDGKTPKLELVEVLREAGLPTDWIDPLRRTRNLLIHQTAPWIAFQITERSPLKCNLVVMKENINTLDDPTTFVTEPELVEVRRGLRQAVGVIPDWLKEQLERQEGASLESANS